jgi:hypothetical protein
MKKILALLSIAVLCLATVASAQDLTSGHFIIRDPTVGTGGGYQASGTFKMYSAGNLNISGDGGSSASYKAREGFLQYPEVHASVLSASTTGSTINLTWTPTTVANGYTVSGYNLGIATVTGGPYTFTAVGNVLSYSYPNQIAGNYFFVVKTFDAFGNVIATSNEATVTVQEILTFSLSANSISFGPLSPSTARYATTGGGTTVLTPAHTITAESNATNGYTVNYNGPTLTSGSDTISPATITASTTGSTGSNQFALSVLSGGVASIPITYDQTSHNWNFTPNTMTTIATTPGPAASDTLNAYYLANAATLAPAGAYTTTLIYEITANY